MTARSFFTSGLIPTIAYGLKLPPPHREQTIFITFFAHGRPTQIFEHNHLSCGLSPYPMAFHAISNSHKYASTYLGGRMGAYLPVKYLYLHQSAYLGAHGHPCLTYRLLSGPINSIFIFYKNFRDRPDILV